MRQYLHGQVLQPGLPDVREVVELILGLPVMHRDGCGKIDHSGEHGDVKCRHLLAAHDYATVHGRSLNLLAPVHVHTCASHAVVCTLDYLDDTHIQRVLVFVEQHKGVGRQRQHLRQ